MSAPTLIDYYLDRFLPDRLGLPELPKGQVPEAGWMVVRNSATNQLKISACGCCADRAL